MGRLGYGTSVIHGWDVRPYRMSAGSASLEIGVSAQHEMRLRWNYGLVFGSGVIRGAT